MTGSAGFRALAGWRSLSVARASSRAVHIGDGG